MLFVARGRSASDRQHASAGADRYRRRASWNATRVRGIQSRRARGSRNGDLRDSRAFAATDFHRQRTRPVAGHREQDRRSARTGGDVAARQLHPIRATCSGAGVIVVETAARLHFGVLDLRGSLGRWFGGIGAAAPGPTLRVSARPAHGLRVDGEDAERALEFAQRFLRHYGLNADVHVHVGCALPRHKGLGSGRQLALAVGRAIAEVNGITTTAEELAKAVGRTKRSAVGTWTFAGGGLVVEGGRRREGEGVSPLLA